MPCVEASEPILGCFNGLVMPLFTLECKFSDKVNHSESFTCYVNAVFFLIKLTILSALLATTMQFSLNKAYHSVSFTCYFDAVSS